MSFFRLLYCNIKNILYAAFRYTHTHTDGWRAEGETVGCCVLLWEAFCLLESVKWSVQLNDLFGLSVWKCVRRSQHVCFFRKAILFPRSSVVQGAVVCTDMLEDRTSSNRTHGIHRITSSKQERSESKHYMTLFFGCGSGSAHTQLQLRYF